MATAALTKKTWLITGCSTGLGRELALAALAHGDNVVATARKVAALEELQARGALTLELDVTASDAALQAVVAQAVGVYGTIDVLVNNAGYFLEGAVEECSAEEVQHQFNTNVFGMLNVCRAVLPYMRAQKSGVVANVGSVAGWAGYPDSGLYCASKFAVAGLTESLRGDVAHLGIEVTCIEPGYFRTAFLVASNTVVVKTRILDLEAATAPITALYGSKNGKQAGDPIKGAKLIVEALTKTGRCVGRALPARLALGKDAVAAQNAILQRRQKELNDWAELVSTTDFDEEA